MNSTTMCSSTNLRGQRHRSAVPSPADASRCSDELTQDAKAVKSKKTKTSKSFHGSAGHLHLTAKPSRRTTFKKHSRSFNCSSSSLNKRTCSIHPEVIFNGDDDNCPKCSIHLMRTAAQTLQRRAAELEVERMEMEADEKAQAKIRTRKNRKQASSTTSGRESGRGSSVEKRELRANEIDSLRGWATTFEQGPAQRSRSKGKGNQSAETRRRTRRQYSIGDVAQPFDMEELSSRADMLIKIARLREGDGAFVKRSGDIWTYATLKARDGGPDATLSFTVNERGSNKKLPVTHWAKFVRLIADNAVDCISESEEEEFDIDQLYEPSPDQDGHAFEKSLDTFASAPTTGSADSVSSNFSEGSNKEEEDIALQNRQPRFVPSKEFSSEGAYQKEEVALHYHEVPAIYVPNNREKGEVPIEDFEVSMFTLGLQDESLPPMTRYDSIPEEDEPKPQVTFKIPRDEGEGSARSSTTSVSEGEFSVDYDADAEQPSESEKGKPRGSRKASMIPKRSRSLPMSQENVARSEGEQNRRPKCRASKVDLKHRVSWSAEIPLIKEEIDIETNKYNSKKPVTLDSNIAKKKLKELNMGKTSPQQPGHGRHLSFHSALKSIHRRSSVMMPPTSSVVHRKSSVMMPRVPSVAVNLN